MHIILFISIVLIISFLILLFALAKRNPDEKQTEDKEQEEYIRDYAETVREIGGTMKKLEHWKSDQYYGSKQGRYHSNDE